MNIPGFWLHARDAAGTRLTMRVVSGEPQTPTPAMHDRISYLEFSPYWNVPDSITRHTLLPSIARNPRYLAQQGFDVVHGWSSPARIVDPSTIDWIRRSRSSRTGFASVRARTTMGLVKFMFPNDDAIYLHDTPAQHRFEERRRAFSHGCVRVEAPESLAHFLLDDDGTWSRSAVERAMHDGERRLVNLPEQVPVHLTYFTTWVDEHTVHFRADLYGLDAEERVTGSPGVAALVRELAT